MYYVVTYYHLNKISFLIDLAFISSGKIENLKPQFTAFCHMWHPLILRNLINPKRDPAKFRKLLGKNYRELCETLFIIFRLWPSGAQLTNLLVFFKWIIYWKMQLLSFFFHEQVLRFILRLLEHIVKSRDFGNDFLGLLPVSLTFDKRVSVDFSYSVLSNNQLYSHLRSKQNLIYNHTSTLAKKHSVFKLRGMLKKSQWFRTRLRRCI